MATGSMIGFPERSAIGAISGTSMDGIDVAFLKTDGTRVARTGLGKSYPYPDALRRELLAFLRDPSLAERDPLAQLEAKVTEAHVQAVALFMREFRVEGKNVDVVGMHGQTVWHRPERRFTRQLVDGVHAARRLGLDVVTRFRDADVAAGGQGAPFAPLYHRALAAGFSEPLMVLNLGGVGNVTYLDAETTLAFDTGPASALLDDFVRRRRNMPFDAGGALAAAGTVDQTVLAELMANPFFAAKPPKSLDRNDFHARAKIVDALGDADGAATLAAFTVAATAAANLHVPQTPRRWLVAGGGRLNAAFMEGLREALGVPVEPVETVGWNGDFLEAELFAFLAVRSLCGLPLSLPTTTGVPHPMPGGRLARAP
jgi:anhydro-N-acetylmuramic acid kinase